MAVPGLLELRESLLELVAGGALALERVVGSAQRRRERGSVGLGLRAARLQREHVLLAPVHLLHRVGEVGESGGVVERGSRGRVCLRGARDLRLQRGELSEHALFARRGGWIWCGGRVVLGRRQVGLHFREHRVSVPQTEPLLPFFWGGALRHCVVARSTAFGMTTSATIGCCVCGTPVDASVLIHGHCASCAAKDKHLAPPMIDLDRELLLHKCDRCGRYRRSNQQHSWVHAEDESPQLLALALKLVQRPKHDAAITDARFLYTEPHSRRLKLKLTLSSDLGATATLQRSCVAEIVVHPMACDECARAAAKQPAWSAKVQLRQKAEHPRTLLALEQYVLLRQRRAAAAGEARDGLISIERVGDNGLDFCFARRQGAQRFASALSSVAPCKTRSSSCVIAANARLGTSNVQHVWIVEVAPVVRGDLVLAPRSGGGGGPPHRLALVARVGASIHCIDPTSGDAWELTAEAYWRAPFAPLASRRHQSRFAVLDCEPDVLSRAGAKGAAATAAASAFEMADATLARAADFGTNDELLYVRTHLGAQLEAGDEAMGYDLAAIPLVSDALEGREFPDVLLVAKARPEREGAQKAGRRRPRGRAGRRRGGGGAAATDVADSMDAGVGTEEEDKESASGESDDGAGWLPLESALNDV